MKTYLVLNINTAKLLGSQGEVDAYTADQATLDSMAMPFEQAYQLSSTIGLDFSLILPAKQLTLYVHKHAQFKIVCAAIRAPDGFIVAGPRHFDNTMIQILFRAGMSLDDTGNWLWQGQPYNSTMWTQGFIDQLGLFYTRKQAHRLRTGNTGVLTSEDLY